MYAEKSSGYFVPCNVGRTSASTLHPHSNCNCIRIHICIGISDCGLEVMFILLLLVPASTMRIAAPPALCDFPRKTTVFVIAFAHKLCVSISPFCRICQESLPEQPAIYSPQKLLKKSHSSSLHSFASSVLILQWNTCPSGFLPPP